MLVSSGIHGAHSIPRSDRAFEHVRILAQRHPRTKFVSIVGDKCIPNLPDVRIPMFIIYRKGDVLNQIPSWGADRERRIEGKLSVAESRNSRLIPFVELEAILILAGAIVPEQRMPANAQRKENSDDDESDDEPPSRSRATATNGRSAKNIRGSAKKDDDSDSDFDI